MIYKRKEIVARFTETDTQIDYQNNPRNLKTLISNIFSSDNNNDDRITADEIESSYQNITDQLNSPLSRHSYTPKYKNKILQKKMQEEKDNLFLILQNFDTIGHKSGISKGSLRINNSDKLKLINAAKSDLENSDFSYSDFVTLLDKKSKKLLEKLNKENSE